MPIDEERYLVYVDRSGKEARITYPNLFDFGVRTDDDVATVQKNLLEFFDRIQTQLRPVPLGNNNPWNTLVIQSTTAPSLSQIFSQNTDLLNAIIDAIKWKNLDIESKYAHVFDLAMSQSSDTQSLIV